VSNRNEYLIKICVLGNGDVQKTKIIRKYSEDKFDGNYLPTLGVDITTKKTTIKGNRIKIIIVDTAGQEFFGKLRPSYYRGASGALIFCNIHN
jgi:Ras-related protein Rab-35